MTVTSFQSGSVDRLIAACRSAYDKHAKSCSHAVWEVLRDSSPNEPFRNANDLVDFLSGSEKWKLVDLDAAHKLACAGVLVIGGVKSESGHGHVIVVYPGPKKVPGGYEYSYKGKMTPMRGRAEYPLCMSTSIGSWPGAMSCGDKTVWDPWANDLKFSKVKFWTGASS